MIIDCRPCKAKVQPKSHGEVVVQEFPDEPPYKYALVQCPICDAVMLGGTYAAQIEDEDWTERLTRVWPDPAHQLHASIPELARKSLTEARLCYNAEAFLACAVMCGRTIEAICSQHNTRSGNLAGGLRELRDQQVIDGRLFEWSDALRVIRNIGAHASPETVTREDAKDVLDFALAICEYVYVLTDKYESFKSRQAAKAAAQSGSSSP